MLLAIRAIGRQVGVVAVAGGVSSLYDNIASGRAGDRKLCNAVIINCV